MPGDGNTNVKGFAAASSPSTDVGSMASAQDGYDAQQIMALARHPPPGASVYSPTAIASNALNPRSCVTCRRRKVCFLSKYGSLFRGPLLTDTSRSVATNTCHVPTAVELKYHVSSPRPVAHRAAHAPRTQMRRRNSHRVRGS